MNAVEKMGLSTRSALSIASCAVVAAGVVVVVTSTPTDAQNAPASTAVAADSIRTAPVNDVTPALDPSVDQYSGARLVPADASKYSGVGSAADVYSLATKAGAPFVAADLVTEPGAVSFYLYSNDQIGALGSDGSVKLSFRDVPAYVYSWHLKEFLSLNTGLPEFDNLKSSVSTPPTPQDCTWHVAVDAKSGHHLLGWETCGVGSPIA